jgi:hypothetical protein
MNTYTYLEPIKLVPRYTKWYVIFETEMFLYIPTYTYITVFYELANLSVVCQNFVV